MYWMKKVVVLVISFPVLLWGQVVTHPDTLETYFETGDIPTQTQFQELIRSYAAHHIPTIDSLEKLEVDTGFDALIYVKGYTADGDGGGGMFYWEASSTVSDDSGTVFEPTYVGFGGTGRWKRILPDGRVTPQMFGAIANGSESDGAVNDAAVPLQQMFDSKYPKYIPAGAYYTSTALNLTQPMVVRCEGGATPNAFYGNPQPVAPSDSSETIIYTDNDINIINMKAREIKWYGGKISSAIAADFRSAHIRYDLSYRMLSPVLEDVTIVGNESEWWKETARGGYGILVDGANADPSGTTGSAGGHLHGASWRNLNIKHIRTGIAATEYTGGDAVSYNGFYITGRMDDYGVALNINDVGASFIQMRLQERWNLKSTDDREPAWQLGQENSAFTVDIYVWDTSATSDTRDDSTVYKRTVAGEITGGEAQFLGRTNYQAQTGLIKNHTAATPGLIYAPKGHFPMNLGGNGDFATIGRLTNWFSMGHRRFTTTSINGYHAAGMDFDTDLGLSTSQPADSGLSIDSFGELLGLADLEQFITVGSGADTDSDFVEIYLDFGSTETFEKIGITLGGALPKRVQFIVYNATDTTAYNRYPSPGLYRNDLFVEASTFELTADGLVVRLIGWQETGSDSYIRELYGGTVDRQTFYPYIHSGIDASIKWGDIRIAEPDAGIILFSPDSTAYRITVDNAGALGTETP